jgi:hypothetical protein
MTLGGSGELDRRAGNQCGAENGKNGFAHDSFSSGALLGGGNMPRASVLHPHIVMARADYCDRGHHEAANKILNQEAGTAKYSAAVSVPAILDLPQPDRSGRESVCRESDG